MRIMIVESDWQFEIKACQYFEARADMVVRQGPESAGAYANTWHPDLVILAADYVNDSLLSALRCLPSPPALLITEHMSRFDRAWKAWQIGGDELLMKPVFHIRELHDAVVTALERSALNAGNQTPPLAVSA